MPPKTTKPSDPIFPVQPKSRRRKTIPKRRVSAFISTAEKTLVDQIVRDIPHEITTHQVTALSHLLERPIPTVRKMIEDARTRFVESAGRYVDIHLQSTEGALADQDYETAAKAAQWALTNISGEGARVVDRADDGGPSGPKVMIGIKLGGLEADTRHVAITAEEVTRVEQP